MRRRQRSAMTNCKGNTIGFDVSTRCVHYAVVCGEQVLACGELGGDDDLERIIEQYELETAIIEAVPFVCNHRTAISLAMSVGALRQRLRYQGIQDVCLVSVAAWKKALTGKGNASKEDVKGAVMDVSGLGDDWPQDVYDSVGVAIAGQGIEHKTPDSMKAS